MEWVRGVIDWLAGGSHNYMTLYHCMGRDLFWIVATVVLDLAVAAGYTVIAFHWWQNQRGLRNQETRRALGNMRNIFIFCGLCGYLFIPIKMVWPAWRLYDLFLVVLAYYTWRYAWGARDLKVIYRELGKSAALSDELAASRADARKRASFLNALGHDLRNPLYAISLQADAARAHIRRGNVENLEKSIELIRDRTIQAARLLSRFIEMGQTERLEHHQAERHTFNPEAMVERIVSSLEPLSVSRELIVDTEVERGLRLETDETIVERVLWNLLVNALQFSRRGKVKVRVLQERGAALIEVEDNGPGIASEHQEKVFDEFFQVDNPERDREKGFGLGLATAKHLVERLGGTIELDSEPGRGSRFTVVLPGAVADELADREDGDGRPAVGSETADSAG